MSIIQPLTQTITFVWVRGWWLSGRATRPPHKATEGTAPVSHTEHRS